MAFRTCDDRVFAVRKAAPLSGPRSIAEPFWRPPIDAASETDGAARVTKVSAG